MLLIYSTKNTARLEYTLKLLFETVSEIDYQFTSDKTEFEQAVCPKLNYSEEQFKTELSLKPHTLLFEEDIKTQEIDKIEYSGSNVFSRQRALVFHLMYLLHRFLLPAVMRNTCKQTGINTEGFLLLKVFYLKMDF